jgi:protein SCO1/2
MFWIPRKAIAASLAVLLLTPGAAPCAAAEPESRYAGIEARFELLDRAGALVTEQDLRGKFVLLAFGFTHCAHICPMMAANMAMVLNATDQDAVGVFISVDTERDTPAVTDAYARKFHPLMQGLGGSHEQVRAAANHFGISYVVTKSQKAYTVEHTSDIFLLGPDGRLIEIFALNAPPLEIAQVMRQAANP